MIKGCNKPFEEDTWKKIIMGEDADDNLFFVVARSTRCVSMYIQYIYIKNYKEKIIIFLLNT